MRMHLALDINIPNRATSLIEYLVVLIFRFIAQFIKTNKIGLTVLLSRFKDFKDARQYQGHLSIFQGSRTQRDFKANSRTILEIQGRLATLAPPPPGYATVCSHYERNTDRKIYC